MNILLEIADRDIIIIALAFLGLLILGIIIFYIVNKNNKIEFISEEDETAKETPVELTEEQKKAKEELERVFNQMSADLEAKNPKPDEIEDFERMQEENAIISYQELIRQAELKQKEKANVTSEIKEEKVEEAPTEEIKEIIRQEIKEEPIGNVQLQMDMLDELEKEPKKFKNSEIISPIFGIQSPDTIATKKAEYKKKIEYKQKEKVNAKHAYDELKQNYEDENNKDFLNSLKEFRNNL